MAASEVELPELTASSIHPIKATVAFYWEHWEPLLWLQGVLFPWADAKKVLARCSLRFTRCSPQQLGDAKALLHSQKSRWEPAGCKTIRRGHAGKSRGVKSVLGVGMLGLVLGPEGSGAGDVS